MSFLLDFTHSFFEDNNFDDSADKMSRQWMTGFLIFLIAFLGLKQFVGDPIQCFTPQYFSSGQELYVDGYCWTASTYQILDTKYDPLRPHGAIQAILNAGDGHDVDPPEFDENHISGHKRLVSYYQWVPLIVSLQAILFYCPYLFWKSCSGDAGVDIEQIAKAAGKLGECEGELFDRHMTLNNIVDLFDRYIKVTKPLPREEPEPYCGFLPQRVARAVGLRGAVHYCFMYIVYKLIIITNLGLQLYGLHMFLGTNLFLHGLNVFYSVFLKQEWVSSERFPINTVCEFRGQPQVHGYLITYNAHCVLPINLYNDKLYAIMSLMFAGTLLYTVWSLFKWLKLLIVAKNRNEVILKHLRMNGAEDKFPDGLFDRLSKKFLEEELKPDGAFLINMIDDNCSSSVTDQIVVELWLSFLKREMHVDKEPCVVKHVKQETQYGCDFFKMVIKPDCEVHGTEIFRQEHERHSSASEDDVKNPNIFSHFSSSHHNNNNSEKTVPLLSAVRVPTDV